MVNKLVPRTLARFVRVASTRRGHLTLLAENGAVAAKLKQIVPRLREALAAKGKDFSGITVRVQTQSFPPARRPPPVLSAQARQSLARLASDLPPESPLWHALSRLLSR